MALDEETKKLIDKSLETVFDRVKEAMYSNYEILMNSFPSNLSLQERADQLRALLKAQIDSKNEAFNLIDMEYIKKQLAEKYNKEATDAGKQS